MNTWPPNFQREATFVTPKYHHQCAMSFGEFKDIMNFNRALMTAQGRNIDDTEHSGYDYRNYNALVQASHDPENGYASFLATKEWFSRAKDDIQERQDMRYASPDSTITAIRRLITGQKRADWTQLGPAGGRKKYKKTYKTRKHRKHRKHRKSRKH